MVTNWLKLALKFYNSSMGLGGIAIIVYGVLMIRVWQTDENGSSSHHITIPWFFHAFVGVGIALCATTCLGHIAAKTANVLCLSCYISIVLLLLLSETVIMADLFLNPNWEKELPENLFDRIDEFNDFVKSNDFIWRWVVWAIFLVQGVCVLLATILRTHETNEVDGYNDEMEDEDSRQPLLLLARASVDAYIV
ncbi:UNVERIFIED_CONTAM: hypothetical protein Slati_2000400 [Sesamum latifolium]|uniref:Tetraspanin-19-like n=1 Tax=Sesamum latifolium TaxID=2727402 RepID=A0AAW2WMC8_9LAMI